MAHSSSEEESKKEIDEILNNVKSKEAMMQETNRASDLTPEQKLFVMKLIQSKVGDIEIESNVTESSGEGNTEDKGNEDDTNPQDDKVSGQQSTNTNDFDKVMRPVDFFEYIVTCIEDKHWNTFEFSFMTRDSVNPPLGTADGFLGRESTKEKMLDDVREKVDILNSSDEVIARCENGQFFLKRDGLTKNNAERQGYFSRSRLDILTKHLSKSRNQIMMGMGKNDILEGDVDFVDTDHDNPVQLFQSTGVQQDKEYAIVVAGESGAGKTCFSYLAAEQAQYTILYKSLSVIKTETSDQPTDTKKRKHTEMVEADSTPKPEQQTLSEIVGKRYKEAFPTLNKFLRNYVCLLEATGSKDEVLERLYDIKAKLNISRDLWATEVLRRCMEDALCDYDNQGIFISWLKGKWMRQERPKKLAIVIDEVVDTDLAEGLVSTVRETTALYRKNLVQDHVRLVIIGTGLDHIRYGGRVGTNPAYSRLIVVQKPNVKKIRAANKKITDIQYHAIVNGSFSRFLCSNS